MIYPCCLLQFRYRCKAEGFFRKYAPKNYIPISAGTRPVSNANPLAIEVMREIGIHISEQRPKILTEDTIKESSVRVNLETILQHRFNIGPLMLT
ncbi:MAG: hypothetical protein WBF33_15695 [Candidatus Nitrosopolaris sp.]